MCILKQGDKNSYLLLTSLNFSVKLICRFNLIPTILCLIPLKRRKVSRL